MSEECPRVINSGWIRVVRVLAKKIKKWSLRFHQQHRSISVNSNRILTFYLENNTISFKVLHLKLQGGSMFYGQKPKGGFMYFSQKIK